LTQRRDSTSLVAGLATTALGTLLLLDQLDALTLGFPYLAPAACAAVGAILVARPRRNRGGAGVALGAGLLALAALLLLRALGWFIVSDAVAWPLLAAAVGGALIWRQTAGGAADETAAIPEHEAEPLLGRGALSNVGLGAALVVGAALVFLWANGALNAAGDVVLAAVVIALAIGLILAPLWLRVGKNLADERAERIRSQERAELAAHLHDSVLQTLALVQRRADDPREVAQLARRQERELRSWLLGRPSTPTAETLSSALERAAAEIEDLHGATIEVVVVGDCPLDERAEALAAAAREAMLNAAKFAGDAGPVDVFAEVGAERVEVFVRDRGPGFDPQAVPAERHGLRESVIGRVERLGGRALVTSRPGSGTEVELRVERRAA
jgi:signal transduction histidine kinase